MNETFKGIIIVILALSITIGIFYFKKWFNYSFFYEDSVKIEMKPLEKRVNTLELQVSKLIKQVKQLQQK